MPGSREFVIVDRDLLDRVLASDGVRAITDPHRDVPGTADMAIRMAEFWDVIDIVSATTARTFASKGQAGAALFDGAQGGGFGIREFLRQQYLTP